MTTPLLSIPELPSGQNASPETINEMVRKLEAGAYGPFPIEDDDLLTPASLTPSDGQVYMINGTGSGGWTGHNNSIALYLSTGWVYYSIREGMAFWIKDENKFLIALSSSTFQEFATTSSGITTNVRTVSGTSDTPTAAVDINGVIEFTNAGAITLTIPTNASQAFPVGTFIEIHQAGAGQVTPTAAGGVTLDVRTGFTKTAGQYAIAAVRKVATNTWRLTGDLA